MFVDFNILNQLGSPSINSNTFANRPSAGQVGRLFVSTDTFEIYRDNGTGWDLIGGPGSSTVTGSGAAGQVTYWTGTNSVGGENNLWWDAANNRFGVNTNTPTAAAEVVQTDGVALYSNFTTNAGSGTGTTALWAINNTNSSGYAAVIEEKTPNTTAGQYPLVIKHSLSSGTAGVGMGTGLHFQLPDDAGTYKTTQLTIETIDAAAATYKTRYRFMVQNNGSSTAVAYLNSTGLGLFTATPGAALDIHSTGTIAQFNTTSGTGNTYIAFQRTGTGIWRIGDTYNGGNNFFELHNTVLGVDAMEFQASTNKSTFQAQETYTTGQARGNYFDYNLSVAAGGSFSSPNAITSLGASLDLTLAGNATIPSGARSGLDAYNTISFTGTGTLTQNQGSQLRTYANLTTGWAFNGSATGTITHLSGIHVRFPDNSGSAVTITNNYGLLINDQTANTGTVTYTNRWGIYQEGASDLNYFAANTLIGTTVNAGYKLDVNGSVNGASFYTTSRYIVNSSSSSGVSDISLGSYANGLWINTPSGTTGYLAVAGSAAYSFASNLHTWYTDNGGGILPRMTLTAAGLFGIGTSAPTNILQTYGSAITVNDESTYSARFSNNSNKGVVIGYDTTNNRGHIGSVNPGVAWTSTVINANGGNLLVGTTSDVARLTVKGANSNANFEVDNGSDYIYLQSYDRVASTHRDMYFYTTGPATMVLKNSGNLLVGTTTDNSYKFVSNGTTYGGQTLEVSGAYGNTQGQLSFAVTGWGNASTYTFDLANLLPRVTLSTRGIFVLLNIITQTTSTDTSVATVQAIRTIGGTWTFNSIGASGTNTMTFSGSGTTITITFSSGGQYGQAAIQFLNQG